MSILRVARLLTLAPALALALPLALALALALSAVAVAPGTFLGAADVLGEGGAARPEPEKGAKPAPVAPAGTVPPGPGKTDSPGPTQTDSPKPGKADIPGPAQTEFPGPAQTDSPKPGKTVSPGPAKLDPRKHAETCAGCSAEAVWKGFLEHLRETGHEDLAPPEALPPEGKEEGREAREEHGAFQVELVSTDPVKGVLFKLSPDLVNLDAAFSEAGGEALSAERAAKARELARKLRESSDPYLAAYGILYGARIDIEAGECAAAVKGLDGLVKSCFFLPRKEAHRHLARAYSCTGDDTLALLELQFFLLDIPPEDDADANWAGDELKKIRDKKHPGPLHHSEENMRSISTSIAGLDVGDPTQAKERRVEDILDKVAKLLERKGGT